ALYQQVHESQKLRLVTIAPSYIPALAETFGDAFRTAVIRHPEGQLLGFVTTLRDQEGAVAYYIGFDKATAAAGAPLSFRLLQAPIEDAIALGARWVSLGRTALEPKVRLGARPHPMCCFVRHRVQAMNLIVRGLLQMMPEPDAAPDRSPFKG